MNQPTQQQENAFNKLYSRFKLVIFFKTRANITHYGHERSVTVKQIACGKCKTVTLDRAKGFMDCLERINVAFKWYGAYTTALIYDKLQGDKPIYKVVADNIILNAINEAWSISPEQIECLVELHPTFYKIVPLPDFKKELEKNL